LTGQGTPLRAEKRTVSTRVVIRQPDRCPPCKRLTVDAWVHRLNQLCWHLSSLETSMHPSAWHECLQPDRDEFTRLAQTHTCDCNEEGE